MIEVIGLNETIQHLDAIGARALDPAPGLMGLFPELEHAEEELFEGYDGKYVRTGALRDSLTQPAGNDAIRIAHGSSLIFGSSVWYARFQGTTGKGRHKPPSAVLKVPPGAEVLASKVGARYIVEGLG